MLHMQHHHGYMMTTTNGAPKHEVIARRHTFDGQLVQFWSDGAITVGHELSNRLVARNVSRKILWLIANDVSLYDAAEVKVLVKAARKALDLHERDPYRTRECDLLRVMRAYCPNGGATGVP